MNDTAINSTIKAVWDADVDDIFTPTMNLIIIVGATSLACGFFVLWSTGKLIYATLFAGAVVYIQDSISDWLLVIN